MTFPVTHTLRDATVLVLWLHHLDGIIFQVEVDLTPPDPVRLVLCLGHSFLEECFKTQSLKEQKGHFVNEDHKSLFAT